VSGGIHNALSGGRCDFDGAITGSTGAFSAARGLVHIHQVSEAEANLTVHIVC